MQKRVRRREETFCGDSEQVKVAASQIAKGSVNTSNVTVKVWPKTN